MSYRPVLRTLGVGALALLLGIAGTLPASAEPDDPGLPPAMVAAMERDLGVTAEQLTARLSLEATNLLVAERLRTLLGGTFTGTWIDRTSGELFVGTTASSLTAQIRALGAQAVVQSVADEELQRVQTKLDEAAAEAAPSVGAWYIDPKANAVVIATTSVPDAESFVDDADAAGDPVKIQSTREVPRLFADLVGGDAITTGNSRCSIGFSARSASATYVITAGHCTDIGGTWSGNNGATIGPVTSSNFPTDDFGAIQVTNTAGWTATSQVAGSSSMLGSSEAAVGASVCRSGSTTGYRCGTLQARNATVNYGGGDIVYGLMRTSACAEPGDSGGSFVAGRQAQGMTSGGSGNCTSGGTTYFQPINEALISNGLTLVNG